MPKPLSILVWTLVSLTGAGSLAFMALQRGEQVSAAWLITAAVCTYLVAFRFYSAWICAAMMFALMIHWVNYNREVSQFTRDMAVLAMSGGEFEPMWVKVED